MVLKGFSRIIILGFMTLNLYTWSAIPSDARETYISRRSSRKVLISRDLYISDATYRILDFTHHRDLDRLYEGLFFCKDKYVNEALELPWDEEDIEFIQQNLKKVLEKRKKLINRIKRAYAIMKIKIAKSEIFRMSSLACSVFLWMCGCRRFGGPGIFTIAP